MITYHGTSHEYATDIINNGVDITRGGGELGQGFYVGDLFHKAIAWAWNRHHEEASVIIIEFNDDEFINLNLCSLNAEEASSLRYCIKRSKGQYSFSKGVDAIWAPIVGQRFPYFNQIKFEASGKVFIDSVVKKEWKTK